MKLDTRITAVVVYPDRARVTRTAEATLEPGSHRLEIQELPLSLDAASVRAAARGTARARLLGVDVRREFYVETPAERVRELEQQIESLQDEMRGLDGKVTLLKEERQALRELLQATDTYARGLAYAKTKADDQMELFAGLRRRAGEADEALLDLAIQRREMERRLEKLQRELNELRGARGRQRYTAAIELEVSQAGDLTLELIYVIGQAAWTPLYDMRLLEGEEEPALEVGYLAQVTQRTGEDWDGVELTLSTARPALASVLPELRPWYVRPLPPPSPPTPQKRMRMARASAPAPMEMEEMALGAVMDEAPGAVAEAEAEQVMAQVETSGTAVTYRVPSTVSVPADGSPHKVAVATFNLTPELDYVTAPKLVAAAYRRAQVDNESDYTLLAGPANLFSGDEFIGTTGLELTAPGGEIELYLGVDDRVKVERELKQREVDKRLLGDRRRLRYAYEIELHNLRPVESRVLLQDQIPVARHENIKVKLESADPKPSEEIELGLLEWELTLAPREERVVRFEFLVEHPRDMPVQGLP